MLRYTDTAVEEMMDRHHTSSGYEETLDYNTGYRRLNYIARKNTRG